MKTALSHEEQIFMRAIEIEHPAERSRFLNGACEGNQTLKKKLDRMLSLHSRHDNILDRLPLDHLTGQEPEENPVVVGANIGPYQLLEQIGIGGMGVIYKARQTEPVDRLVAIKIIKLGEDSRNVIARFESERQALAMMEHPHITKFFDAGMTPAGRPYFVMELIDGQPITAYSDERALGTRQRMELFFDVCNAIQHAHQKGIIHRDIKPSNVMVTEFDDKAVPKVIDFGISKAVHPMFDRETLFTSYGNILGTPEYMSPEQAEMNGTDVDTCSDVYSLGVLLYELMTGSTPLYEHRKGGLLKFCDAICNIEPSLASTHVDALSETKSEVAANRSTDEKSLRKFLTGDVDWILAKCLAKRREDRYSSVAALAEDIGRYLNNQPVLAGGPSWGYRFGKFVSRNRFVAATAIILMASLILATTVSLSFAFRAFTAEALTKQHLQQSQEAQEKAEIERDRALAAEAKIKDLEQASRLEASISQAIVRYLSQQKDSSKDAQSKQVSGDPVDGLTEDVHERDERPLKIEVSPKGKISMIDEQSNTVFECTLRSRTPGLGAPTRRQLQKLEPTDRRQAKQVLSLVTEEVRKRFGRLDLFVAEPKLMLAELELQDGHLKTAERHVRQIARLLINNFSRRELRAKNQLLLAVILAKQDINSIEAIELLQTHHEHLTQHSSLPDSLANVVGEIGLILGPDGMSPAKGGAIRRALKKLIANEGATLDTVFESMEVELQQRTKTIR